MKQQVSKTCKPQGFEGSNPSLSVEFKDPALCGVLNCRELERGINCFMPRRDLKAGAMFWFASAKSQGQNREAGLQEFSVRKITGREIPLNFLDILEVLLL